MGNGENCKKIKTTNEYDDNMKWEKKALGKLYEFMCEMLI